MTKVTYFIGSNNVTKELESEKAQAILSKHFDGFTVSEVIGYWKGAKERTLRVEVLTDLLFTVIEAIGAEIAKELEQDAVLVEVTSPQFAFAK